MIAKAAVVLPQPDSPTSPYDSPWPIVSVSAAQDGPVDAADAVDDLEIFELEGGRRSPSSLEGLRDGVGDQVDADDQRRDREGREEDGPPDAAVDEL